MTIYDKGGAMLLDIEVDDNSYRYRAIMGEDTLTLYFALPQFVEVPLGAYCVFQGEKYSLVRPEALKMLHTRNFEYMLQMESEQYKLKLWKFRNPTDERIKFALTAKPREHLEYLIQNLSLRESGWAAGECVNTEERVVTYDNVYLWQALEMMAKAFDTEFEIKGRIISLRKVERNKNNPLPLAYGKGRGFVSGVSRSNYGDTPPVETLYVLGGGRNIDSSKYGANSLRLPKGVVFAFDGTYFEDEAGFDEAKKRTYQTDKNGLFVKRTDKAPVTMAEDSLDCSTIYPKRVGEVTEVVEIDAARNLYDIVDETIPDGLDYEAQLIAGEKMTIIFQSGMLAGREFDVKYLHKALSSKKGKRFELVAQTEDGETLPNSVFAPKKGDKYAVFHCALPQAYINTYEGAGTPKQGAEWEMLRTAIRYFYEHEDADFSFSGKLDGIWAKKNWENVGGRLQIGNVVAFRDERFLPEGVEVRITGIKEYINNPHAPEVELSNTPAGISFAATIKAIESQKIEVEERQKNNMQYTKRRFRDAQESLTMLERGLLDNFTKAVNPAAVQTMQMLVGDEGLQFDFFDTAGTSKKALSVTFDAQAKQLTCEAAILCHYTLGLSAISSERNATKYKRWSLPRFESGTMDDASKPYFLYAVCAFVENGSVGAGQFLLSEARKPLQEAGGYCLLVGILNSEYNGARTFTPLHGFTEILPARITTDKIVSADGGTYFDLAANEVGGKINFKDGLVSGSIGVGNGQAVNAGLSGAGSGESDVRFWAGADMETRTNAPFRVLQDGTMISAKADIRGTVRADAGRIGSFRISNGEITSAYNDDNNGVALSKHSIYFYDDNNNYTNSALIGGLTSLGYPYTARFKLDGKDARHVGTALFVSNTVPDDSKEWFYTRRAIDCRGNVYGVGKACFYHKGYIGAVASDVLELYFNITHKFHFTTNSTKNLEVRLPTKTKVEQILGEDAAAFFELEIVADRAIEKNFVILDRDEAPIFGWSAKRVRGAIEFGGGGVLALRYYNGAYTILYSNVCEAPNGTKPSASTFIP